MQGVLNSNLIQMEEFLNDLGVQCLKLLGAGEVEVFCRPKNKVEFTKTLNYHNVDYFDIEVDPLGVEIASFRYVCN